MLSNFQMQGKFNLLVLIFLGAVLSISLVAQGNPLPEEAVKADADAKADSIAVSSPSSENGTSVVSPGEEQPKNETSSSPDTSGRKDSRFMSYLSSLGSKLTSAASSMGSSFSPGSLMGQAADICAKDNGRSKACRNK